jgi:hypothetical protein
MSYMYGEQRRRNKSVTKIKQYIDIYTVYTDIQQRNLHSGRWLLFHPVPTPPQMQIDKDYFAREATITGQQ